MDAVNDFLAYQESVKPIFDAAGGSSTLYSQVRYVAADSIEFSPMKGRDVAVLSMIVMGDQQATGSPKEFELYTKDGMERIATTKYDGVPHWGKQNWATADELAAVYGADAYVAFEKVRAAMDPKGLFLNAYMRDRGFGPAGI